MVKRDDLTGRLPVVYNGKNAEEWYSLYCQATRMKTPIFEVGPNGQLPTRGSEEAAGLDLYAAHDVKIPGWGKVKVGLDIKSEFQPGWVGLILDRSGLGSRGITHLAGVIDSDFRGEWLVALFNANYSDHQIEKGDRIAQVVFVPCFIGQPMIGDVGVTNRGDGGFGSTGK